MRVRLLVACGTAWLLATAACSAILGLKEPPEATAAGDDATGSDGAPEAGEAAAAPVCAALDAGDGATVYFPFDQQAIDDAATPAWEFFNSQAALGGSAPAFVGGTFDGRYLYFAVSSHYAVRYDTQGAGFDAPSSWTVAYFQGDAGLAYNFMGAVFDGRYVTFVPALAGVAARFDTALPGSFASTASAAWSTFDVSTLSASGGAETVGFLGGVFDGRYVYFVPSSNGAPFGRVVRYDTAGTLDAGLPVPPKDAGADAATDASAVAEGGAEAQAPPGFTNPAAWTSFDVSALNPAAAGFAGAVLGAGAIYFVPQVSDAYDAQVNLGYGSVVARYSLDASFDASRAWSTFDMTRVDGIAFRYYGGAFDGRYVYFVPRGSGVVTRYDTTATFGSPSGWSAYDTTRVSTLDGGAAVPFEGAVFDGRFVYFVPTVNTGVAPIVRYDTQSTFTADCAWTTFDPSGLPLPDGGVVQSFGGAVFDGQYVYFLPSTGAKGAVFVRFAAKSPPSMPGLPDYHGSFF
jgi:hypothetical protein